MTLLYIVNWVLHSPFPNWYMYFHKNIFMNSKI